MIQSSISVACATVFDVIRSPPSIRAISSIRSLPLTGAMPTPGVPSPPRNFRTTAWW